MKNRYEDKFGSPDKEEEGRRAVSLRGRYGGGAGRRCRELEYRARAGN